MTKLPARTAGFAVALLLSAATSTAHEIKAAPDAKVDGAFDIISASAKADARVATFAMEVSGAIGASKPAATGNLTGAGVAAYVWVTKIDPSAAGFDKGSGLLALAVTAHPDFDDTPLFDENGDGDTANDGSNWHSHWVVLGEDKACGAGLKVRDIAIGKDVIPATAPGLPIALDSPGYSALMAANRLTVNSAVAGAEGAAFDAVAAELQVHAEGKAPLLCVTKVNKVASGDLSFPGRVTAK